MVGQGINITSNNYLSGGGSGAVNLFKNRNIFISNNNEKVFTTTFQLIDFDVFVNGYIVLSGFEKTGDNEITFNETQDEGTEIIIQNYTLSYAHLQKNRNLFFAEANQKIFTTTFLLGNYYDVFVNGYLTHSGFAKTDDREITFDNNQDEGTEIIIQNYVIL